MHCLGYRDLFNFEHFQIRLLAGLPGFAFYAKRDNYPKRINVSAGVAI